MASTSAGPPGPPLQLSSHQGGLKFLPNEVLDMIFAHLVPPNFSNLNGRGVLPLRLACRLFDTFISRHVLKKLDHQQLQRDYRLAGRVTTQWLLATKIAVERGTTGIVASIALAVTSMMLLEREKLGKPFEAEREARLATAACGLAVDYLGPQDVICLLDPEFCNSEQGASTALAEMMRDDSDDEKQTASEIGTNPLHTDGVLQLACYRGKTSLLRVLLESGADPNRNSKHFGSAAYAAAVCGWDDVLALLASNGCRLNEHHGYYGTPFGAASFVGDLNVMKVLARSADFSGLEPRNEYLFLAICQDREDVVQSLLTLQGVEVNERHPENYLRSFRDCFVVRQGTPLEFAASRGQTRIVQLLIAHEDLRPDFGIRKAPAVYGLDYDPRRPCALIIAASNGYTDIVRLLLEKYAIKLDGNYPRYPLVEDDVYKDAPLPLLHSAVKGGHLETMRYLLTRPDIDINHADPFKGSPLVVAIKGGRLGVVQFLVSDPRLEIKAGATVASALRLAIRAQNFDMVRCFVDGNNLNINGSGEAGSLRPLLQVPALVDKRYQVDMTKLLLAHPDINPNIEDGHGRTQLWMAAASGSREIVDLLVAHPKTDPNIKDGQGTTPLHAAVCRGGA
ncbi:ankyrin repeat-containing domain protein [Podospora aff. communis PSN243]|uniref:Ankyrin repeat-containing domain protein n=1 Tax=Podospora aff. communis PSN243 TaxID=3040156 RepID=A0AAV9GV56_9PEZI|nr:ankyrin repeat-containing domain protein [Podospora aff. communis PSN243]